MLKTEFTCETITIVFPQYWDNLTPYHTGPKVCMSILLPVDVSKIVLDEWQTV